MSKQINLLYILSPSCFINFERVGFVDRLFMHFQEMSKYFTEIHILSADAKNYSRYLPSNCYHHHFPVLGKRGFPSKIDNALSVMFPILAPFIYPAIFKRCDVYEARYLHGILPASVGRCFSTKPIIVWFPWWWARQKYQNKLIRFKIAKWIEKILFQRTNLILVSNQELMALMREYTSDKVEIDFLGNFIDTNKFSPKPMDKDLGSANILYVGSLTPHKNQQLLLRSVKIALEYVQKPIKVTLIGSGPLKAQLYKHAQDYKIELQIIDKVPNDEIPHYISNCDIFVMTSKGEGNPKALLEAMSCGAACIGTDVSGIRELIQHNVNGILCEEEPESVAAAICKVLSDDKLRNRIQENARRYILDNYSLNQVIKREAQFVRMVFEKFRQ